MSQVKRSALGLGDPPKLSVQAEIIKLGGGSGCMQPDPADRLSLMAKTVEIVSAYVARNTLSRSDLVNLIDEVGRTLQMLTDEPARPAPKPVPAVPISKSVTPDFIISLEDGRKMKSMKRYLASIGMTPAQYRKKWGLPHDYPFVAPNFAAMRSQAAKRLRLGQRQANDRNATN
jgi:predicted transcriptional regulator